MTYGDEKYIKMKSLARTLLVVSARSTCTLNTRDEHADRVESSWFWSDCGIRAICGKNWLINFRHSLLLGNYINHSSNDYLHLYPKLLI